MNYFKHDPSIIIKSLHDQLLLVYGGITEDFITYLSNTQIKPISNISLGGLFSDNNKEGGCISLFLLYPEKLLKIASF